MGALRKAAVRSLVALGLLVLVVTFTPLVNWWAGRLAGEWSDPRGEVLIVLAGGVLDDGIIGYSSYLRSLYAEFAWREGGFQEIVVSGGEQGGLAVGPPMRDFMIAEGVPASVIRLESASQSTRENAVFTTRLLQNRPGRKVLLTSDYHMFRALRAFRQAGLTVSPRPIPEVGKRGSTWRGRWPAMLDLVDETFKIGFYRLRGWI